MKHLVKVICFRDFPGGLVVKTALFRCMGHEFNLWFRREKFTILIPIPWYPTASQASSYQNHYCQGNWWISAGDFSHLVDHPFLKHFLPLSSIILTSLLLGYIFKVPLFRLPYKYEIFPHSLVILRPSSCSAHVLLVIFLTPWLKSQILVPASSVRLLTCMHACLLDKATWLASGHFKPSTFKTGLPRCCSGKEYACQCRRHGFHLSVRKISWRRVWQPTPVFWKIPWTEESSGLQSMGLQWVGHNQVHTHTHTHKHTHTSKTKFHHLHIPSNKLLPCQKFRVSLDSFLSFVPTFGQKSRLI